MVVKARTAQLRITKIETKRLHQMQDRAGYRAQADRGTGIARNTRGVVAQMRCGGFGLGCVFGRQHRVDHGNRIAMRVGHQLIRTVIRLTVAVFEHLLDLGLRVPRGGLCSFCALSFKGTLFIRHKC